MTSWAGLWLGDLVGDGTQRIVTAARASFSPDSAYWYIVKYQAGDHVIEWASLPLPGEIDGLAVQNLDGDPALEVVVAAGREITVYDGATHRVAAFAVRPERRLVHGRRHAARRRAHVAGPGRRDWKVVGPR